MVKPGIEVTIRSMEGKRFKALAVFDARSHYSIIQEAKLPARTPVFAYRRPETLKSASHGGQLHITAVAIFDIQIGKKLIHHDVLVSPDLHPEMIVGAGAMRVWGISVHNRKGRTVVTVRRDIRDPGNDVVL